MKITFFSNYLNHHQLPFCKAMIKNIGEKNFFFVATEPIDTERSEMGWDNGLNDKLCFCIRSYSSQQEEKKALYLADESDIVILGSAPEYYIKNRLLSGKITFHYSERIFKTGRWRVFDPRLIQSIYKNHIKYRKKPLYMLCASAYTASDFAMVGAYKGKAYKWGYFPEVKEYDIDHLIKQKPQNIPEILWCGRMLPLKHPSAPVKIAKKLKHEGYSFHMTIIGEGEMRQKIEELIKRYDLDNNITLQNFIPANQVRSYMEKANIYLFTSDYNEGWGAVLNESMNSGCAVIASHAIGSVPFLINHGYNGFIYKNGDINDLYQKVKELVKNKNLREKIGRGAYITLKDIWNSENAAKRFIKMSEDLQRNNQCNLFIEGPCSPAENISQGKMYKKVIKTFLKEL